MTKDSDIHPALIMVCIVMLGITVGTAAAMGKFPFSPAFDTTKLEAEDLLPQRGSNFRRPGIEVK